MWMDAINGLFETIGALCVLLNVRALLRDRRIQGVHWAPTIFFTSWGIWNCIFYPSLGQWFSTAGGVLLVLANLWWLGLVWHFRRRRIFIGFDPASRDGDEGVVVLARQRPDRTIEIIDSASIPFGPAHPDWPGLKGSQNG